MSPKEVAGKEAPAAKGFTVAASLLVAFLAGVLVGSALSSKNAERGMTLGDIPTSGREAGSKNRPAPSALLNVDGSAVRASRPLVGHVPDSKTDEASLFAVPSDRPDSAAYPALGVALSSNLDDSVQQRLARTTSEIERIIAAAAHEFGQDAHELQRVAFCESSYRPWIVGDAGASVGLFQIQRAFWSENAPALGYTADLRADPVAASRVAAYAFSAGQRSAWTCAR